MARPAFIGNTWPFKQLSNYVFLVLVFCNGCWGCINTNLTECRLCSTQKDAPCIVQGLKYLCRPPIPDTNEDWPGTARNLDADVVDIGQGVYRAEFMWQAPYDSSIDSLRGFLVMVHCEDKEIGGIGPPHCFFANLTDGTWAERRHAHDVKFKFTCVQSSKHEMVTIHLISLPRPPSSMQTSISKTIKLPGSGPIWNPQIDTEIERGPESTTNLKVRFQPLYPGATAHYVVLMKNNKPVNRTLLDSPQNIVTFVHVPSNINYTIWLRPVDGREQYILDHFLESKPFNIPVMPQKRFEVTTGEPAGMDDLQIATVILVPILMIVTAAGTVIFFCRRRGKFQMFRSVPNSQTNEKLAGETQNNQLDVTSQGDVEQDTPTIAVLCSQQNVNVEKISKLFIQFIKSKTEVLRIEESCSGVEMESYIHKWRTAQGSTILLVILSKELLGAVRKAKRSLDIEQIPGLKVDLHLVNLLLEIDRVTPAHLPPVMLVCLNADLCAHYLEVLPNLGQLYSIADDIDQRKCKLRSRDLEQLFVSMSRGQLSPPVTLSHNSLAGCVQTKLLMAAIQELKMPCQSKTLYHEVEPGKAIAMNTTTYQCAYRLPSVARQKYVYRDLIPQGTAYFENGCVPRGPPTYCAGQPIDPRQPNSICVIPGPDNPRHTSCESFSGQVDSGFDTMTTPLTSEEAEKTPFVMQCSVNSKRDVGMKKEEISGARHEELSLFISPESDDEYDGVSLSQRIVELNQRHITQWNKP